MRKIILLLFIALAYACGVISHRYQLPPVSVVKTIYNTISALARDDENNGQYSNAQFAGVISISDQEDLVIKTSPPGVVPLG